MTTTLPPGLARKVKKVLEMKTESAEMLTSLDTLSTVYTNNNPANRRQLRTTIEQRGIATNRKFLEAADVVLQALDAVEADVFSLKSACTRIGGALKESKANTAEMLAEVERLQKALESAQLRSTMVQEFLSNYQLTPEEVAALQGDAITPSFFGALERVRTIHANCRGLLRTHHQRAGLELMDAMAAYQERAYERLCSWVQRQCAMLLKGADDVDMAPLLPTAVAALRERPVLFQYCAQEVVATRKNAVLSAFIIALTKGGPGGLPRPIEMHAHDARRYVGDMLAWVHQALANERELLVGLFGDAQQQSSDQTGMVQHGQQHGQNDGGDGTHGGVSESEMVGVADVLDQVFESVCKPLEVRIDSVLNSVPPPLTCYKLSQLLTFYSTTIQTLLGTHAQLASSLRTASDRCKRLFSDQLRAKSEKLLRYPPPPPRDLSPPTQVLETLQQLSELVSSVDGGLQGGGMGGGGSAVGAMADSAATETCSPVVAAVVDALVDACERSSEALVADSPARVDDGLHLTPTAPRIYLINCFALLETTMLGQPTLHDRANKVNAALEAQLASLVSLEVGRILGMCGLADVVERVRWYASEGHAGDGVLSSDAALALPVVSGGLNALFDKVGDMGTLCDFTKIQSARVRATASMRLMQQLVAAYQLLHDALHNPEHGYDQAAVNAAVKHTPADMKTVMGVDG